jgi:aminoglycoside 2'-N-acetyltransferase I
VSVTTTLKAVADFTDDESRDRRALGRAVYSDSTPESDPTLAREWDRPEWGVMVTDEPGGLVSYTGIVLREGRVDGDEALIGGIGGVATHPDHRGKGYAPLGMSRALDFLLERGADFALLVCRDELVDYYAALGWRLFEGTVLNTQHGVPEVFTFNRVMVGDLVSRAPREGTIDLRGPAW